MRRRWWYLRCRHSERSIGFEIVSTVQMIIVVFSQLNSKQTWHWQGHGLAGMVIMMIFIQLYYYWKGTTTRRSERDAVIYLFFHTPTSWSDVVCDFAVLLIPL